MVETINKRTLIYDLYHNDIIKYGDFTLKSGQKSNIYFDLRTLISFPKILNQVLYMMYDKIIDEEIDYDLICGPAYTGIPMATGISLKNDIPQLIIRKERKDYGTKKLVEGIYYDNQKCLLIDDVITTGSSLIENINILENENLIVKDIIVLIDRRDEINDVNGCNIYTVFTINEILEMIDEIRMLDKFLRSKNMMNQKIAKIIYQKQSNLVLSADLNNTSEILHLVEKVSPNICGIKIHVDILDNFSLDFTHQLEYLADKYNFFIIADRKFADIGNTVKHQLHHGDYKISSWADLVTVHTVMGEGTIEGLISLDGNNNTPGLLLLGQASSQGNLIDQAYTNKTVELAKKYRSNVVGFICQQRLVENDDDLLHFTPGVNMSIKGDNLGQQYNDPESIINSKGSDVIIVGRDIYQVKDPYQASKMYQNVGWRALLKKLNIKKCIDQ